MHRFLSILENELCTLGSTMDTDPTMNACDVLEHREDTRKALRLLRDVVSLRLPNGKLCLDRRNRRILYMYALGYPHRDIASKVGIAHKSVQKRIDGIPEKVLRCVGGDLRKLHELLQPPQSTLEAGYAEVKLGLAFDSAKNAWGGEGYWGKHKNRKAWKGRVACEVPEYLQGCFGDNDTQCSYCGVGCTRKVKPKSSEDSK